METITIISIIALILISLIIIGSFFVKVEAKVCMPIISHENIKEYGKNRGVIVKVFDDSCEVYFKNTKKDTEFYKVIDKSLLRTRQGQRII